MLEKNFEFVYGRHIKSRSARDKETVWAEMTDELNICGVSKIAKGWKKCFQDIRGGVKEKLAQHRRHLRRTGGGGPSRVIFTTTININVILE